MNAVRDWANKIPQTLASLLCTPIRHVEFSDDRLCNLLDRFSDDNSWKALEADLWKNSVEVFDLQQDVLRFDGTAACGYHDITENGLMQFGASKDHRPDLPQLKIMAASIDPGIVVGIDIASGETNDDLMYVPLIQRVHSMLKTPGSLYMGDCKMGAIRTRATIHSNNDCYLMPLGLSNEKLRKYFDELVEKIVNGDQPAELIYNTNNQYIDRIRESLSESKEVIRGLEKGKPNSTTKDPTTLSILQKFVSEQIIPFPENNYTNLHHLFSIF